MSNKLHADLTDPDGIHEPKGISTADENTIYVADGSGSGNYKTLNDIAGGAWTAYTPTIAPALNTFSVADAFGWYKKIGRTVHFNIRVEITTNGTAAGPFISATLPFDAAHETAITGKEGAVVGWGLTGVVGNVSIGVGKAVFAKYDWTYPGANGHVLIVSGTYEATS